MHVSIGSAARFLGVSVVTLRRWEKAGRLRPAFRTPGGHRRYDVADLNRLAGNARSGKTIAYARVSAHDQKADLQRQSERLVRLCRSRGWTDLDVIEDLGSGLNYRKRGLNKLIRMICRKEIARLVVMHKDRLLRFGAELIFALCAVYGIEVVIVEQPEEKFEDRLTADVIELMTVFSARLYGRRAHQNKTSAEAA